MTSLLKKLWKDEDGALIATEYLLLGSVVTVGSVTGLASVRDSVNAEYQDYGNQIHEVRQAYAVPAKKGAAGSAGGATVANPHVPQSMGAGSQQIPPTINGQYVHFSAPTP